MSSISKVGNPTMSTMAPPTSCRVSGFIAGEALGAGDACYIKSSDGKVYRSNGTVASDPSNVVDGFAPYPCPIGEATSLYWSVNFGYGSGLTPGSFVYLDTNPGALNTAPTTGGTAIIGRVIDATRIWVKKSY